MINNIASVDTRMQQQMGVTKASPSLVGMSAPPILSFRIPQLREKALIRVQKIKRSDNIVITGEIDDDYVDIIDDGGGGSPQSVAGNNYEFNFFQLEPERAKTKLLKNCYVIDYIQSPRQRCGLGTEAVKQLAEKAMFDSRAEGRIVTFSSPVWKESSPAIFFYKLGFRFMEKDANTYIEDCIAKKIPDLPPQVGMMYLPKANLHRLLRYGELF